MLPIPWGIRLRAWIGDPIERRPDEDPYAVAAELERQIRGAPWRASGGEPAPRARRRRRPPAGRRAVHDGIVKGGGMRRGFVVGAVVGAVLSLAVGIGAAVLPSTPTWALWRLKTAIDRNDTQEMSAMVDVASVTQRAVDELDGRNGGLDLGQLAAVLIDGGKVVTVFTDPDHPLEITGGDVLAAWWGMRCASCTAEDG